MGSRNPSGRKTYKTKASAKRHRRKGGRLYKVKSGWRISYK